LLVKLLLETGKLWVISAIVGSDSQDLVDSRSRDSILLRRGGSLTWCLSALGHYARLNGL
jgi:hypothetical protein